MLSSFAIFSTILFHSVTSLEVLMILKNPKNNYLYRDLSGRRDDYFITRQRLENAEKLIQVMDNVFGNESARRRNKHRILRQNSGTTERQPDRDAEEKLVETELKTVLHDKTATILNKPRVEKHGKNDFLEMGADIGDPFVTIVPNDIYYNHEKKCVNWLESCNRQGIRATLLQKMSWPISSKLMK